MEQRKPLFGIYSILHQLLLPDIVPEIRFVSLGLDPPWGNTNHF